MLCTDWYSWVWLVTLHPPTTASPNTHISHTVLRQGWRAAVAERARRELADREAALRERMVRERDEQIEVCARSWVACGNGSGLAGISIIGTVCIGLIFKLPS